MSGPSSGADARHEIANVLHTYTEIADRKDVDAAVALLGPARVAFPAGGFSDATGAAEFFGRLWADPVPHRHDVTNLVVHPGAADGLWLATAHYTRWLLQDEPVLHTLGEYSLTVSADDWAVRELTVTRTWTRAVHSAPTS